MHIKILLIPLTILLISACAPSNVVVQVEDKPFFSTKKTELVAGLHRVNDRRPQEQKDKDEFYEKSLNNVVNDHLYKSLKMSGMFEDVIFGDFSNDKVDVVLTPYLNDFFYETQADAKTAGALGISLIPFVGLAYNLAGGPSGEHYSYIDIEIDMTTTAGKSLACGYAEKSLNLPSNLHNQKTDGIGKLDGRVLGQATYDLMLSLYNSVPLDSLPQGKFQKPKKCGLDTDCKGDRICVDGKCVNPDVSKKMDVSKKDTQTTVHP